MWGYVGAHMKMHNVISHLDNNVMGYMGAQVIILKIITHLVTQLGEHALKFSLVIVLVRLS